MFSVKYLFDSSQASAFPIPTVTGVVSGQLEMTLAVAESIVKRSLCHLTESLFSISA
jgi:hypothetical protein